MKTATEQRVSPRLRKTFSVKIAPDIAGKAIDLSRDGLKLVLPKPVSVTETQALIEVSDKEVIEAKFKVVWSEHLIKENKFAYGVCFVGLKEKELRMIYDILEKTSINQIEEFVGLSLPQHIKNECKDKQVAKKFSQQQMMEIIDFAPPFLRTDKMILFDGKKNSYCHSSSLGSGMITLRDTAGHYNDTIYLAMCGWLMASTASVHLAILFPTTAPQVIKADGVKPLLGFENDGIWKPSVKGAPFWVESEIIRKKMQLVVVKTKITFGNILYGTIEELRLVLTKKNSIWSAKEVT